MAKAGAKVTPIAKPLAKAKEKETKVDTNPVIGGLIKEINSHFKKNVVNLGKDIMDQLTVHFLKTPSFKLNQALGGGVALGKIIEFYGPTGSGKTTECYEIIGEDMKNDPNSYWGWYETEHSFDQEAAKKFGVDINRLVYWEIDDEGAESGLDVLESIIRKGQGVIKGIVVNSVAGLTPKSELDSLMGKLDVGTHAKMMSKLMRKITAIAGKNRIAVIFINQVRDKISLFGGTTTTGGRALSFFASQRAEFRKDRIEASDGVDKNEYIKINIKIAKNRFAKGNPYVETTMFARYGVGTDTSMELIEFACNQGIVEKGGGGNYRYLADDGQEYKIRGQKNLLDFFDQNKAIFNEVSAKLDSDSIKTVKDLSDEDMKALEKYNNDVAQEITEHLDGEEVSLDKIEAEVENEAQRS